MSKFKNRDIFIKASPRSSLIRIRKMHSKFVHYWAKIYNAFWWYIMHLLLLGYIPIEVVKIHFPFKVTLSFFLFSTQNDWVFSMILFIISSLKLLLWPISFIIVSSIISNVMAKGKFFSFSFLLFNDIKKLWLINWYNNKQ